MAAGILALCLVTACGIADGPAAASAKRTVSPSSDELTVRFVNLVHGYWVDLIKAEANAPMVCFSGPIQPSECEARATAQLKVQQKFLLDLENTPAPPQFAPPDKVLLDEVPKAIADLEAMLATARTGNEDALVRATSIYVSEMEPRITDALDAIDTSMIHQR